jgi:hypothetical protein
MAVAALALRLLVMAFVYTDRLDPAQDHWTFGWETARVARSVASGQGFSSPYHGPTGPTTLVPPVYVYLVAGVFKLFGVYTPASALFMLTLNSVFSSLTCLPVFFVARRVLGQHAAVWAGWMWAFFPYAIVLSSATVWETTMSPLLVTLVVLAPLRLDGSTRLPAWIGYGGLWGIAALTNPATLSTLPFLGGWLLLRHRRRGESCVGAATTAALIFLAVVAPWVWRSSRAYGRFVAVRGGIGLEVLVGNSQDTSLTMNANVLPGDNPAELEKLRTLGEPAYMAEKEHEARELIAREPLRYAGLTARRILNTWTCLWDLPPRWKMDDSGVPNVFFYTVVSFLAFYGVYRSVREHREFTFPLAVPLAIFPVVYYLTHTELRYRHPVDPIVVIFGVYGGMELGRRASALRDRRRRAAVGGSRAGRVVGDEHGVGALQTRRVRELDGHDRGRRLLVHSDVADFLAALDDGRCFGNGHGFAGRAGDEGGERDRHRWALDRKASHSDLLAQRASLRRHSERRRARAYGRFPEKVWRTSSQTRGSSGEGRGAGSSERRC